MNHIDTMKLALDALEAKGDAWIVLERKAITALREALAEQPAQQQEPVAYWIPKAEQFCIASQSGRPFAKAWEPLYTSPQAQRKPWVGLTPEQRATVAEANNMLVDDDLFDAIEAKLKEKNT